MSATPASQPEPAPAAPRTTAEALHAAHATRPVPAAYKRYPLGLPEGSVRALLALFILGNIWALLLLQKDVPLYLYYLMFLILGHYFGARGHAPSLSGTREWPPLYLPRGSIRLIILVGFVAVFAWTFYQDPDFATHLKPERIEGTGLLMLTILSVFFLGILVARVSGFLFGGEHNLPGWYQDLQSWVSLVAMLVLTVVLVYQFVITPGLAAEHHYQVPRWSQVVLSSIIAFYFGVRS